MSDAATDTGDRLSLTLLFATVVHAVVIFGVGFTDEDAPGSALPALDVILVQSATQEVPEKADFLANAAQAGGGTIDEAKRPTQTFSSPVPKPDDGVAPMPVRASAPDPTPAEVALILSAAEKDDPDLYVFIRLAAVLGARRGEILGICWKDFAEEYRSVEISSSVIIAKGEVLVKETKTDRVRRVAIARRGTGADDGRATPITSAACTRS